MKVGETHGVGALGRGQGAAVLSGPGWTVMRRGEFLLLRAMPILTGAQIQEVSLTEAQMRALRDGDITVEELIQRDGLGARVGQVQVNLSDAAQHAAQAGLVGGPATPARGKRPASAPTQRGASGAGYDHRLTAVALVLAAVAFLFILFGR